ncbi:hypothetical protein MY4038_005351 [Beauveria bassiana]
MKSTAATIAAVVATCAFAQPEFTNSEINPQEGHPFTLRFNGCDNGCTISLQTGPSPMSLSDIHTLTTDATGGSFDVTLSGLDTGIYNFKIADNSDGSCNYSIPFFYVGAKVTSSDSSGGPSTTHVYDASSTSRLSDSACCSNPDSTASKDVSPTAFVSSTHSSQASSTGYAEASSAVPHKAGAAAGFSPFGAIGAGVAGGQLGQKVATKATGMREAPIIEGKRQNPPFFLLSQHSDTRTHTLAPPRPKHMTMATTETTTAATVSGSPAATVLNHTVKPYSFTFSPFLREAYQVGLPADRPICKAYQTGSCPNGTRCTERHVTDGRTPSSSSHPTGGLNSLVCKHWLRGLCKKGIPCEFLHEYNLRRMPECNFFMRNGYCSNGEECLYLHVDPLSKLPPCPHYDMGFCPLGPVCAKKHVRRRLCPLYLAGFCPEGPECRRGSHPKWSTTLERPTVKPEPKTEEELRAEMELLQQQHQAQFGHDDGDRQRDNKDDRFGGRHGGRGGGRGGWRGRGGGRGHFRGRGGY